MATTQPNVLVFKSKSFITDPFRAVFPHVNVADKFGSYSISADVLDAPEFRALIEQQAQETLKAGQEDIGVDKLPTNEMFKSGEYKGTPFTRMTFKMAAVRKVKGKDVKQKPRLVDAQRTPMSETVWGGSLVKVAYFIQYTVMPTGTFLSLKLNSVQVLEHVGPGGEVAINELFAEEEGFVTTEIVDAPDSSEEGEEEASIEGPSQAARHW